MDYIVSTRKTPEEAVDSLKLTVADQKFGVLHIHNLKEKMNSKGIEFENDCFVLEVCNPFHAAEVLKVDMALNMALPCRISVWSESGDTKIGMLLPTKLLGVLSSEPSLASIAETVEHSLKTAIDLAK